MGLVTTKYSPHKWTWFRWYCNAQISRRSVPRIRIGTEKTAENCCTFSRARPSLSMNIFRKRHRRRVAKHRHFETRWNFNTSSRFNEPFSSCSSVPTHERQNWNVHKWTRWFLLLLLVWNRFYFVWTLINWWFMFRKMFHLGWALDFSSKKFSLFFKSKRS